MAARHYGARRRPPLASAAVSSVAPTGCSLSTVSTSSRARGISYLTYGRTRPGVGLLLWAVALVGLGCTLVTADHRCQEVSDSETLEVRHSSAASLLELHVRQNIKVGGMNKTTIVEIEHIYQSPHSAEYSAGKWG